MKNKSVEFKDFDLERFKIHNDAEGYVYQHNWVFIGSLGDPETWKGTSIVSKNSKGSLLAIAQDSQSTHTSQVNLVLKKHIRVAEALIAKYASNSVERLKAELAAFCTDHSENKSGHRLQDLRVTEAYLVDSYDGTNF